MRMPRAIRLTFLSAVLLLLSTSTSANQSLSDADFFGAWSWQVFGNNTNVQAGHDAGGYNYYYRGTYFLAEGNPGNFLKVDVHHPTATYGAVDVFLESDGLSTSGIEIDSVQFSFDAKCLEHEFNAYYCNSIGLGLRQDEKVYVSGHAYIADPADGDPHQTGHPLLHNWKTHSGSGLNANSFWEVLPNGSLDYGSHPDFSAAGGDIRWGLSIRSSHTVGISVHRVAAIDNLSIVVTGSPPASPTRTPWQMHDGLEVATHPYGVIPFQAGCSPSPRHGAICEYLRSTIPDALDPGWMSAPDGDIINFSIRSRLCWEKANKACRTAGDFTYFQTFVDIPEGTAVTEFKIAFQGMDDGSRISICNSMYPTCEIVAGSYVYLGGSGTTDLSSLVVGGEVNRVVITQVDDCCSGNNLRSARVTLNGEEIDVFNLSISQLTNQEETGSSHVVSALLTDQDDLPIEGVDIEFEILFGPNQGLIGIATTNAAGQATFSYLGVAVGTDQIQARFDDNGVDRLSNLISVEWIAPPNSPPEAVCSDAEVETDLDSCEAFGVNVDGGSWDPDDDPLSFDQAPAGPYQLGSTQVTLTVDDGELSDSCAATVTVRDGEPPAITCPATQVLECTGNGSAEGVYEATATDNCSASVSCGLSGTYFPLGSTSDTCIALDGAGNEDRCSVDVIVQDTRAPSVACNVPSGISGSDLPLSITATGDDICSTPDITVSLDGCTKDRDGSATGCSVSASGATLTIAELGKGKTVHWTATAIDGSGNMTTANCSVSRGASNQGLGNGPEGSDPGNSNQGDPANSNDENGGTPGNPGKKKGK